MLVDFYQKGQPLIVRLAKEAKIPTSYLARTFDIDLRFGEREVNDQEYAKRKYCKHSYDDKAYYRDQFWRDVEKDMLERQSWQFLNSPK